MEFSLRQAAAILVFVAVGVLAFCRVWWGRRGPVRADHHRGRALRNPKSVGHLGERSNSDGLRFGQRILPDRMASGHFAFVGATGSGKTILQRLLMQSVLPAIGTGRGCRAIVYDAKQDAPSILAGMQLGCPVHILNPFDARCVAWDMATDITAPAAALQAATLLIPETKNDSNPFFTGAARQLVHGVLLTLITVASSRWTLRHALLLVRDEERLKSFLSRSPVSSHLLQYFNHPGTSANILSTVLTYTAPFEIIAAAWDAAESKVSLRGWFKDESILVLGNDEACRAALDTMNRLIFKRLVELLLALPEKVGEANLMRRTWFFLDEVREAGRLDGLSSLLTKGRSKGACVSLGFQDINGLRAVYGREAAEELVGQASSKAILRINTPETARWATGLFGAREVLETHRGQSRSRSFRQMGLQSGGTAGESLSHAIAKRDVVLDSEILDLPETNPEKGLTGYFLSPATGGFRDHITGDWLAQHLRPCDNQTENCVPRSEAHQYLRPWDENDARLLGVPNLDDRRVHRGVGEPARGRSAVSPKAVGHDANGFA